jgi:hypothetical protein
VVNSPHGTKSLKPAFVPKRARALTQIPSAADAQAVNSGVARSVSTTVEITRRITLDLIRVFVIRRGRFLTQMRRPVDVLMERFGRRISAQLTVGMRRVGMGMRGSVFVIIGTLYGRIRSALVGVDGR